VHEWEGQGSKNEEKIKEKKPIAETLALDGSTFMSRRKHHRLESKGIPSPACEAFSFCLEENYEHCV
jgi:hypothetical protein